MKKQLFYGAATALVTPFDKAGNVEYDVYRQFLSFQINHGIDALVVNGTTGESATLTDSEKERLLRCAVEVANGHVPVIAGTGSNDTAHAVELSKNAAKAGADGLLVVTPYYNKTTQNGLIKHYSAIAAATDLPIILYNVPSRTGMSITPETYGKLKEIDTIVATKEASGDISHIARVFCAVEGKMGVYSGNDDQIVPILSLGGIGVISVLSNLAPALCHTLCSLYREGKTEKAAYLQLQYLPLIEQLFAEVNPIPIKWALEYMGHSVGNGRPPLDSLGKNTAIHLQEELEKLHLSPL